MQCVQHTKNTQKTNKKHTKNTQKTHKNTHIFHELIPDLYQSRCSVHPFHY